MRRLPLGVVAGVGLMVADHVQNALWAFVAPRSYHRALPGAEPGTENALDLVLTRDLAVGRLVLAALLLAGLVISDRRLLPVALTIAGGAGTARLLGHLLSDPGEGWLNWAGYVVGAALPFVLLAILWRRSRPETKD